jgi:transmembrane sensor
VEPMNDLEHVGRLVAEQQNARLDELADLDVARSRFLRGAGGRSKSGRAIVLMAAALGIAASLAFFIVGAGRGPAPLTFRVGGTDRLGEVDAWLEAPGGRALPLRFSDGTAVLLEPSARARVTRIENTGATLRMESGRADVSVAKRKGAAWQVSLGPFRVDVTGTRFDIDWDPGNDQLFLAMHEGSVVVSGCVFGAGRPFVAGETVRASCREQHVEISRRPHPPTAGVPTSMSGSAGNGTRAGQRLDGGVSSVEAAPAPSETETRAGRSASLGTATNARAGLDWRELVRNGRHGEALDAAEAAGFSAECAKATAADLVALGDSARYVGRLERAVEAYQSVRRRFPGQERSAIAAFALGRIAFDQRADYAGAARWFRTYLGEQPRGRLDRDALGRLMESLNRLGDASGARQEAKRYLDRHPTGPHAEMARRLTAE